MTQAPLPIGIPTAYPTELRWLLTLPAWAQDQAQQRHANRLSTTVRAELCLRCGAIVLHALDDEYDGATTARTDPTLITPADELKCLLANRPTYELTRNRRLRHRHHFTIGTHRTAAIVPAHRCHQTIGFPLPWEAIYDTPPEEHTECPF